MIDARANDPVEAIRELTHGEGAHKTLDTSGAAEARAAAVRAARTWGTACYVGERGQVTLDVSPDLLRRQITLVGSWTFSTQGQADCAEFVADHDIAVDKLFTHRWRLDQAEEAYRVFDTQTHRQGRDPAVVTEHRVAWTRALQRARIRKFSRLRDCSRISLAPCGPTERPCCPHAARQPASHRHVNGTTARPVLT